MNLRDPAQVFGRLPRVRERRQLRGGGTLRREDVLARTARGSADTQYGWGGLCLLPLTEGISSHDLGQ